MEFDNLHQVLANLYQDMLPLCGDIIGVAKGLAGSGAMFYVANRVWQALARAEPIDCIPFTSSVCHWIMYSFFPTIVLGTINTVMSPVVKSTHTILESQTLDLKERQKKKEQLEYEARLSLGEKACLGVQTICKGGERWKLTDGKYMRRKRDVWSVPTRPLKEAHFAAYPPDLVKPCILAGCPVGGVVLDPFMGAGTTALVARELGRHYVGIELNPEYVGIAERRLG